MTPALSVRDLTLAIGGASVVDGLAFDVAPGEVMALVGESGCGKSLTALAAMRLLPPAVKRVRGHVALAGVDLYGLSEREVRRLRGRTISMIFQEPLAALDPLSPVGAQIAEGTGLRGAAARQAVLAMMEEVGISDPVRRIAQYPFELSGGMAQRVMIASALVSRPDVLIADEPTTALDVTIQAQILELLRRLAAGRGTAILLITHDMGAVAEMADRVMVMYAGRVIEQGTAEQVLGQPGHPYTRGLIDCLPELGSSLNSDRAPLAEIAGVVPSIWELSSGCAFRERCPHALARCGQEVPPMFALSEPAAPPSGNGGHGAACWLHAEDRRVAA